MNPTTARVSYLMLSHMVLLYADIETAPHAPHLYL